MNKQILHTSCCVVGGGPAGMMVSYLLARAGIDVILLEKHKDFFRDFRGDTIHPSTFQIMHELGLLVDFLKVPHQEIGELSAIFNGRSIKMVDFSHLNVVKPVVGLMPQWDFLNFLCDQALKYPSFKLLRETNAFDLLEEEGVITGIKAQTPNGPLEISAKLVIGADGRSSVVRDKAKLPVIDTGASIDVLWFRLSRKNSDPGEVFGNFYYGQLLIMLNREDYWQCAYVIDKNGYDKVKEDGLDHFKKNISDICGFLNDRVEELRDWDDIKLLNVKVDHLETWYRRGLICIGDAAHAMSPVGGVGINLALQDAVATANILWKALKQDKKIPLDALRRVQKRRAFPARMIQRIQVQIHKGIGYRRKHSDQTNVPLFMRMLGRFALLRRIPAMLVGKGIRMESVRSPKA